MEGKLFYGDAALPTAAEHTDFIFDLQRFALKGLTVAGQSFYDDTEAKGSDSSTNANFKVTDSEGKNAKYFTSIHAALNYIYCAGDDSSKDNSVTTTNNPYYNGTTKAYTATIQLLKDQNKGDSFLLGGIEIEKTDTKKLGCTTKLSNITIDLNGFSYLFGSELDKSNADVSKTKAIKINRNTDGSALSNFTITSTAEKAGTLGVSSQSSTNFQRLIRSYANLTIENVTIDGKTTPVSKQNADLDGALICHSAGVLELKGNTNILTKENADDSTAPYYAISGKRSNENNAEGKNGFEIIVNVNQDCSVGKIGLLEWQDQTVTDYAPVTTSSSAMANADSKALVIKSGIVEDVVISKPALDEKAAGSVSISGGTVHDSLISSTAEHLAYSLSSDEFKYNSDDNGNLRKGGVLYEVGFAGWNKDRRSTNETKWNYVASKNTTSSDAATGQVLIGVTGAGDDSSKLKFDGTHSLFGIPEAATAAWSVPSADADKYFMAKLNYKGDNGVTLTTDKANATIDVADFLGADFVTVNASDNEFGVSIKGNAKDNVIYGGKGNDSLTGNTGKNVFVYNGGNDLITDYKADDKASLDSALTPVTNADSITKENTNDLVLNFSGTNKLTFVGQATQTAGSNLPTTGVKVESGKNTYYYTTYSVAEYTNTAANGITLNSNAGNEFIAANPFVTIDASAVSLSSATFKVTGMQTNNYIVGAKTGGSLDGNGGDDTLVGGAGKDVFIYKSGKNVINDYGKSGEDKVSIGNLQITDAKVNAKDQLIFSTNNKNNTLTFNPVADSVVAAVSLDGGGLLTKSGEVDAAGTTLKLFAAVKGKVSATDTVAGYNVTNIDASAATANVVTLEGASNGGTYTFAANKKADVFQYGGGSAVVAGYVASSDKINLGDYTYNDFTVDDNGVVLTVGEGSVSIGGAKGKEVLLHDGDRNKANQYSKLVFADNGVLQDKESKPTSVTISGGNGYEAGNTVKKIFATGGLSAISIVGGNVNTAIDLKDASLATGVEEAMSIVGGTKNDKITAGAAKELFVYKGGKDVITGYGTADSISLDGFDMSEVTKTTKSGNTVTLKFKKSSDALTIKGDSSSMNTIAIGGASYAFGKKNTIYVGGVASLTSGFSGTYTADTATTDASSATKNLTIKGLKNSDDTITAGNGSKTMLKGQGGNDNLVGGSGVDTFYYKKGEKGNITIENFDADKDKIKISGSKVITDITKNNNNITFNMDGASINLNSYGQDGSGIGSYNGVVIRANNTCYWFDNDGFTDISGETHASGWVTSLNKITASKAKGTGYAVVDLGYSTNLVKAGLAYKVNDELPTATATTTNSSQG